MGLRELKGGCQPLHDVGDIVTNLQLQIDELKETDGILCSDSVIKSLGLGESTCSEALIYLDSSIKQLIDSIVNMYNFIKTGDYYTAGTFSHKTRGNAAKAILVGAGGGGGGGGVAKYYSGYGGGAGGGGAAGTIVVTDIITVNKNTAYPVIVGKKGTGGNGGTYQHIVETRGTAGGTSSVFSVTAAGGAGGGIPPSAGNRPSSANGTAGSGQTKTLELTTIGCGSGGGGGTGGNFQNMVSKQEYTSGQVAPSYSGGAGIYGSGNGGSSGTAKFIYTPAQSQYPTTWYNTWIYSDGGNGSNAGSYGSGGGGGGGTYYGLPDSGDNDNNRYNIGSGGKGGDGYDGRVVIYERGIFQT